MFKDDRVRLKHMFDAATEALEFMRDRTREDLDEDRMLLLSTTKSIEIVGEAASKVSFETRNLYQNIEWAGIIGMRNKLSYGYYDIDNNIVWATIIEDLPRLVESLEKILSEKKE